MTNPCTCKAEHWQPHADACPAKVERPLLTLDNIRSGAVPSDAVAVGYLLGKIEQLRVERDYYIAAHGRACQETREALSREVAALRSTVEPIPVHPDPDGKTREPPHCPSCSCGMEGRAVKRTWRPTPPRLPSTKCAEKSSAPQFKVGDYVQVGPPECETFGTIVHIGSERAGVQYDHGPKREPMLSILSHAERTGADHD